MMAMMGATGVELMLPVSLAVKISGPQILASYLRKGGLAKKLTFKKF
jgi:hypothetical protein